MARLLVLACLVLVAVVAIQAKPQSKRSEVRALKRALEHEKEKSLAATKKREMQQELMKKKAMAARAMKKAALKRHIDAAKKRQLLESESESEGSGSSTEWSFSDIELSDWEWPESWGEPPSWMPDSWFDKEKEDVEDEPEVKPKDGSKKDKPAQRPRAMKKLALKRHLAAQKKRQEMPPPPPPPAESEESEGSGISSSFSFSDLEWKDSWSSSYDLSEWEWPESWGEPPSWVPDVWLPKPEKEDGKKKPAGRLRAMKKGALKRHLADAQKKRQEMPPPPPPPAESEESEGSGISSSFSFSDLEWKDSWSSSYDLSEWEWPESWGEPPSWVPDVWLPKPEKEDGKKKPADRLRAMKKSALKRHLADAQKKRQEMPPPPPPPAESEESEGSGISSSFSFSDWEWKDSWSSSYDLSEWEWPESWGEPPSWVPDVWLPKPKEEKDSLRIKALLAAMKKRKLEA